MAISTEITYEKVDDLFLDPHNPRLGRENTGDDVRQDKVLELMQDWNLEELALSFTASGFWPQEALLIVEERLYGKKGLVVVEGNRRLAALKLLKDASEGRPLSGKWADLARGIKPVDKLFQRIPVLRAGSRKDIEAFLGFRHVTGIMEWRPAEKAEYITKLIDQGLSYEDVRKRIGSKTETVRRNYISYRLLLQMEDEEGISVENVEDRFSVLFLSLRTVGVQKYLQVEIKADPAKDFRPVPKSRLKALAYFALWLFGNKAKGVDPIVQDSRQVDNFGQILESAEAVKYLERSENPSLDFAFRLAGGDEIEIIKLVEGAADNIEEALSRAHHYKKSSKLQKAVGRLGEDIVQLLGIFPAVQQKVAGGLTTS